MTAKLEIKETDLHYIVLKIFQKEYNVHIFGILL